MSNTYSRKQKFWAAVFFLLFLFFSYFTRWFLSPQELAFFKFVGFLTRTVTIRQIPYVCPELQIYQQLKGKTKMIWNGCWNNINLTSDTWCSNIATVCVRKWLFCSDVQACTDRKTTHSHMLDLYSSWYSVFTEKLRSIYSHCSLTIAPVMNRE